MKLELCKYLCAAAGPKIVSWAVTHTIATSTLHKRLQGKQENHLKWNRAFVGKDFLERLTQIFQDD